MTYAETINYLFNVAPLFQNIGQGAYKEGLSNTFALDEHFGHPHKAYQTIHVAGTNGKGSCSHTIAAILQEAGYKVGLYTSPHLVDFRERIRVNGEMISEQRVIDFVEQERDFFEPLYPSFFELSTALAFVYFKEQKVDAVLIAGDIADKGLKDELRRKIGVASPAGAARKDQHLVHQTAALQNALFAASYPTPVSGPCPG